MTTVLLTGFSPFAGDARNPSEEVVRDVAQQWEGEERLVTEILPVAYDAAGSRLRELIAEHIPDVIIAVGLAGGRTAVTPERVAINLRDARIPDNAGARPVDEPSVPGGPAAHFATLPVKAIVRDITRAGIPAAVSDTAGTFVCNHTFYVAADAAATTDARAGFIHVPWSAETAPDGAPSIAHADLVRAIGIAIRTTLGTTRDLREPAGDTH
ncbi:pyroglutamyl-peptidase I [Microbacterium amylolyticum]|uniref:Pyrrolidone-carboxylate peptidase n=1 Tax=Microbacterium amylolyticum TaxID=936337 RepID=A0ABS4ZKP9_9MICO|nr:pyroglutamyl-peptidase I [Microbacterium amylolyticum]MBP2437011.1 pyroglutamyl-peptidase [Microbacterium amylolyticum]